MLALLKRVSESHFFFFSQTRQICQVQLYPQAYSRIYGRHTLYRMGLTESCCGKRSDQFGGEPTPPTRPISGLGNQFVTFESGISEGFNLKPGLWRQQHRSLHKHHIYPGNAHAHSRTQALMHSCSCARSTFANVEPRSFSAISADIRCVLAHFFCTALCGFPQSCCLYVL